MNRRSLLKAAIGGAALVALPQAQNVSAKDERGAVASAWRAWHRTDNQGLYWFNVVVVSFDRKGKREHVEVAA